MFIFPFVFDEKEKKRLIWQSSTLLRLKLLPFFWKYNIIHKKETKA